MSNAMDLIGEGECYAILYYMPGVSLELGLA